MKPLCKASRRRVDDVGRRIEIRLPDLEMDDVAALRFQRSRLHQDFESRLRAETRHAPGKTQRKHVPYGRCPTFRIALCEFIH